MTEPKVKIGLIVNPIAGMGGKVALKGTDGDEILETAKRRGAIPESEIKTERAIRALLFLKESLEIVTCSGHMGELICRKLSLPYEVKWESKEKTTDRDTYMAALAMVSAGADFLLFAGGDGTARTICEAIGTKIPVLGIPAGVKIQSAVFALNPEHAGKAAALAVRGRDFRCILRDVADLDENAYRMGHVSASVYGKMAVLNHSECLQNMKQSGFTKEENELAGIADYVIEQMETDVYYIIGSGTTAKCVMERLELSYELLGIDIIRNKKKVAGDVTEGELWKCVSGHRAALVVSPIGGQGFLFGRGNHQLSSRILKKIGRDNILVVSQVSKLLSIEKQKLHIDCGNEAVEHMLSGYRLIITGYKKFASAECVMN